MLARPKILSGVPISYNFEKMPKTGFRKCIQSPVKTKIMVIETSNMAKNDW